MSQPELSRACGLAQANVSHIECGHKDLTVTTLCRIAAALGVGPAQLLASTAPPHASNRSAQFMRDDLEAIAQAVTGEKASARPELKPWIRIWKNLIPGAGPTVPEREVYHAWHELKQSWSREMIESVRKRIQKSGERVSV